MSVFNGVFVCEATRRCLWKEILNIIRFKSFSLFVIKLNCTFTIITISSTPLINNKAHYVYKIKQFKLIMTHNDYILTIQNDSCKYNATISIKLKK